ncbi:hypothetical protein CEXT_500051 [Caerostris extrusa]|uniref:Uncharacterized protein n=1 Tax=Caerostris extrusa TaxID=172846 RepID=A0AAV4YBE5_CAEEX|nr:hypothetical protein CEXT_500051 [Caerostris extrusa]
MKDLAQLYLFSSNDKLFLTLPAFVKAGLRADSRLSLQQSNKLEAQKPLFYRSRRCDLENANFPAKKGFRLAANGPLREILLSNSRDMPAKVKSRLTRFDGVSMNEFVCWKKPLHSRSMKKRQLSHLLFPQLPLKCIHPKIAMDVMLKTRLNSRCGQ